LLQHLQCRHRNVLVQRDAFPGRLACLYFDVDHLHRWHAVVIALVGDEDLVLAGRERGFETVGTGLQLAGEFAVRVGDHPAAVARDVAAIQRGGDVQRSLRRVIARSVVVPIARALARARCHPERGRRDDREDQAGDRVLSESLHEPTPQFRKAD
jgi:hypothetical protein